MTRVKELTIYKRPDKEFKLLKSEQVVRTHRRLYLESAHAIAYDDVIWAEKDKETNKRENILVVEFVYDDSSVRVRLADSGSMRKLRQFEEGEIFLLIASYKEDTSGNTAVHIS